MSEQEHLPWQEIRELAKRFSPEEIEACIQAELEDKNNPCYQDQDVMRVVNVLAKAEFVRKLMDEGKSLPEAIRELGRRIRAAQGVRET